MLEEAGELHRIKAPVSWDCDIGAVAEEAIRRRERALLFENITDYRDGHCRRLLINALESPRRMSLALALGPDTPLMEIIKTCKKREKQHYKPRVVASGPCKEVIYKGSEIDLLEFPAPRRHVRRNRSWPGRSASAGSHTVFGSLGKLAP